MPSDPFIGEIYMSGINFAPNGYLSCVGQLLSIAQNTALFALLGTTYGGDGRTTFGLPDLRGRVPIGQGTAPGLSAYNLGQVGGSETVTLNTAQIPAHNHGLNAYDTVGDTASPNGSSLANTATLDKDYIKNPGANSTVSLAASSIATAGGNQPHSNIQPYLTVNYYIAIVGVFPTRG